MRILFAVNQLATLRHFESTLCELADRGHTICIAAEKRERVLALSPELSVYRRISQIVCPSRRDDAMGSNVALLRSARDYLRYLDEPFRGASKLRLRALREFVKQVTHHTGGDNSKLIEARLTEAITRLGPAGLTTLKTVFRQSEDHIPSDAAFDHFLKSHRPDILLVTPLVALGSQQADLVKSAHTLRIPVGFPVFSWDNLTNKGVLHALPDRVFVWNDVQRREAIELHEMPPDRVTVTGAARFDRFFARTLSMDRGTFCQSLGLEPAQRVVAYLCSSEFVAGDEAPFVRRWIDEVRQHPALTRCGVVIRPHPRARDVGDTFDTGTFRQVAVAFPRSANGDQSLFDLLHHSAAVVALNTSAELEAGIVGRPVLTIEPPEFEGGQGGTLHFRYLLKDCGGFVERATDFSTHRDQLARAICNTFDRQPIAEFIARFVRPMGFDRPVTPMFADAIERLAHDRQWLTSPTVTIWTGRLRKAVGRLLAEKQTPVESFQKPKDPSRTQSAVIEEAKQRAALKERRRLALEAKRRARGELKQQSEKGPSVGVDDVPVVALDYDKAQISLVATTHMERDWRARSCSKEPWTVDWLEESLGDGGILYDIGANVGAFSIIAAKICGARGTVVAFEPAYATFAHLCDNIVLNGCEGIIVPVCIAVGEQTGLSSFAYKSREAGQSRHQFNEQRWDRLEAARSRRYLQPILSMPLDRVTSQFDLPKPNHIKLDVDGAELNVLRGAATTLRAPELRSLLIEIDETLTEPAIALLQAEGFVLDEKFKRRHKKNTQVWYGVFRREGHPV